MRQWNYRLVITSQDPEEEREISICEVYYDSDGTPRGFVERTVAAVEIGERSPSVRKQLEEVMERMREALDKPILRLEKDRRLVDTGEKLA